MQRRRRSVSEKKIVNVKRTDRGPGTGTETERGIETGTERGKETGRGCVIL